MRTSLGEAAWTMLENGHLELAFTRVGRDFHISQPINSTVSCAGALPMHDALP